MAEFDIKKCAIIVNALIVVFVAYSILNLFLKIVVTTEFATMQHPLLYYTNWSNIFAAIASACYIYCIYKGIKLPKAVAVLKLASVMMLTVTFLVVIAVLCPTFGWAVLYDLGGMLFLHFLVPVLAVVDILFLADIEPFEKMDSVYAVIPMALYAVGILSLLIIVGNDSLAPYPFLKIHTQPIYESVIWFFVLFGMGIGLSYLYTKLVNKYNPYIAG